MSVHLSEGEWKLMSRLWEHDPQTITELTAALKEETGWSKHTIISMLSRLEAKGTVAYRMGAKAKQYRPLLHRGDAAFVESKSFLDKVYGGSLGLFVNTMVQSRSLTQEDLDELSALLTQAKEESP